MILYEYCLCNVFFLYQVELNFVYYEENLVVRDKLRENFLIMVQIFMYVFSLKVLRLFVLVKFLMSF